MACVGYADSPAYCSGTRRQSHNQVDMLSTCHTVVISPAMTAVLPVCSYSVIRRDEQRNTCSASMQYIHTMCSTCLALAYSSIFIRTFAMTHIRSTCMSIDVEHLENSSSPPSASHNREKLVKMQVVLFSNARSDRCLHFCKVLSTQVEDLLLARNSHDPFHHLSPSRP